MGVRVLLQNITGTYSAKKRLIFFAFQYKNSIVETVHELGV